MTDIKLPPSRSPAMDKVEQRAWELLEAECGKPLPFDVPTHAALSAIRAALTAAHQQGQPVGDDPIDASSNAEYIEHCADRLERLGLRVTAVALRAIAHEHRALAQQPAAVVDDTRRIRALADNYWRLEPFDMPTPGGDDADVGWRVIEFHRAEPRERVVVEHYRDNPREAIDAALAAQRQEPKS